MIYYLSAKQQQQSCIDMLEDYYGLVVTVDQLEAALARDTEFRAELIKYNSQYDTADREVLGNLFMQEIVGRRWPTYGDGDIYAREFYADLRAKAPAKGYQFLG